MSFDDPLFQWAARAAALTAIIAAGRVVIPWAIKAARDLTSGVVALIAIAEVLKNIAKEFSPNGGSTLRDVVEQVRADVSVTKGLAKQSVRRAVRAEMKAAEAAEKADRVAVEAREQSFAMDLMLGIMDEIRPQVGKIPTIEAALVDIRRRSYRRRKQDTSPPPPMPPV